MALGFFLAFLLFFRREKALTFFGESVELAFESFSGLVVHTRRYIPNRLNGSLRALSMPVSETEFKSWCYRNGGETYGEEERGRVACRFPDADVNDRVGYFSESGAFEVITDGRFYSTRSLHQHADSRIDDADRLLIDTDETRVTIDPR